MSEKFKVVNRNAAGRRMMRLHACSLRPNFAGPASFRAISGRDAVEKSEFASISGAPPQPNAYHQSERWCATLLIDQIFTGTVINVEILIKNVLLIV